MEEAVVREVAAGSTLIAFISVFLMPISIWDSQTGRYYGFFNWKALGVLLFTGVYFGAQSYRLGNPPDIIMADIGAYLFLVISGARIFVEGAHHDRFGVWLRKQYHKLTDHDDPAKN